MTPKVRNEIEALHRMGAPRNAYNGGRIAYAFGYEGQDSAFYSDPGWDFEISFNVEGGLFAVIDTYAAFNMQGEGAFNDDEWDANRIFLDAIHPDRNGFKALSRIARAVIAGRMNDQLPYLRGECE